MRDYVMIVGCGMMGSGIGAMSALAGNKTVLIDVDDAHVRSGLEKARECVRVREENGLNTREEAGRALSLIETSTDMAGAASKAFMVIEAIIEKVEAKRELFARLDAILPADVPICSNTSGLRITDISAACSHPERAVTTHFWLPAHLVPLVEVVMGEKTDAALAGRVVEALKRWKKSPVLVRKDLPGQLANRIFQAIIREAVDIVASGLASAEDVDTSIAAGMAMRFPVWGPLMHLDAVGTDLGLSVQRTVLPSICADRDAGDYLKEMVQRGDLGAKTGKGFYDWTGHGIETRMEMRDQFIIEAVKATDRFRRSTI